MLLQDHELEEMIAVPQPLKPGTESHDELWERLRSTRYLKKATAFEGEETNEGLETASAVPGFRGVQTN